MFDKIFAFIKPDLALTHMQSLIATTVNLLAHFKDDFLANPANRDAAIDQLIEILKSQKGKK